MTALEPMMAIILPFLGFMIVMIALTIREIYLVVFTDHYRYHSDEPSENRQEGVR